MNMMRLRIVIILLIAIVLGLNGCATISTINNSVPGSPKFFSGTRLDITAMADNKAAMKKFTVQPPKYPLLDLPASFVLDLCISPVTSGIALYEVVFEPL